MQDFFLRTIVPFIGVLSMTTGCTKKPHFNTTQTITRKSQVKTEMGHVIRAM